MRPAASPSGQPRRRPDLSLTLPPRKVDASDFIPVPRDDELAPAADPATGPPPEELERVRQLGGWVGGTVWMVRHRTTGRAYALKVLDEKHDHAVRRQLAREVAVLRTVEHPAVVRCHGMYERDGGELQILLEFMDGGSLHGHHIPDEHSLSHVARQVLSGIAYLHRRHIVHRGIRPFSLLIDAGGRVKMADFGIGRILNQTVDLSSSLVSTIAYMSPERINNDLNHGAYEGYAGDIWSFGLSILELHLGRFSFGENFYKQGDWAALMCAICYLDPPEPLSTASAEFRDFIRCCLQKNPARRPTATRLMQHPFISGLQPQQRLAVFLDPSAPSDATEAAGDGEKRFTELTSGSLAHFQKGHIKVEEK
ncbi:hypothetical protein PR202_ga30520 [Eleusine coracana subsp. coracana]|uniref:Protein kinase domain-containing protein n=1 Tax=Eleusine coracana subsp. coracana TaxID=191504 RepID=A0AAV5DP16_ELECO|nr:hypothetical protein PR202_ga30486 [Eleusine coracana subsp. coracana]GJN12258.1 hypothetical protein PR202_ga30520 [Eleusine coracana subsp. coracana]